MDSVNKPTYILGICCFGKNDSGVCLLEDGELRFAAEGERYSRIMHDTGFPGEAILDALRIAGIRGSDIQCVAYYSDPKGIALQTLKHLLRYFPRSLLFLRHIRS